MIHKYGNYLISTLFTVCNSLQRQSLLEMLGPSIYNASFDMYGIHPMQKLLSLSLLKVEIDYVRKILKDRIPILSQVDNYTE